METATDDCWCETVLMRIVLESSQIAAILEIFVHTLSLYLELYQYQKRRRVAFLRLSNWFFTTLKSGENKKCVIFVVMEVL